MCGVILDLHAEGELAVGTALELFNINIGDL